MMNSDNKKTQSFYVKIPLVLYIKALLAAIICIVDI